MKKTVLIALTALTIFTGCQESKSSPIGDSKKERTSLEKIQGEWYYTDTFGNNRVYAVNKKYQFTDDLDSKSYGANTKVTDTGSSLKFDNGTYTFDIQYPKIVNNCFDFKLIKKDDKTIENTNAFKLCKLDDTVEQYCGNYYKKNTIDFFIKWATPYGKKPENMSFDCDKVHPYIEKIEEYKAFESKRLKEILKPSDNISQKLKEIKEENFFILSEFNKGKNKYDKKIHGNKRDYYQSLRTKTISSEQQKRLSQLKKEEYKQIEIRTVKAEEIAKKMTKEDYKNLKIFDDYNNKYDINYSRSNKQSYIYELMGYNR